MIKRAIEFVKKLLLYERTPSKLAFASSVGIFIAFSPFLGIHWLLTIIFAGLLRLNVAVVYATAHVVNNPFTMIGVYWAGYKVGQFFVENVLHIDLLQYNPSWMDWLNVKLSSLGIPNLSLWTFIIGGNISGLLMAIVAYPFLLHFYKRIKGKHAV